MRIKHKTVSKRKVIGVLAIGILSFSGMAYTANWEGKNVAALNSTSRVIEYIDPFAMTVTTYVPQNSASGSVGLPKIQLVPHFINNATI
ncbi:MAG: hypothetical protein JW828_04240 [Sedimentisphaerales bacterium]|nr:hypothetical protein [Sedimentisphaerales bacterium]